MLSPKKLALALPSAQQEWLRRQKKAIETGAEAVRLRTPIRTLRRVVFRQLDTADIEEAVIAGPGPDEILVQVELNAISIGTETAALTGLLRKPFPYQPGYSGAGHVTAVGKNVSCFAPGDRVAGQLKNASLCRVHQAKLFRIPENVDVREAAFIELGIIALQGVRKAGLLAGAATAVIGSGIVGSLTLALARLGGAVPCLSVAKSLARSAFALHAGASEMYTIENVPADCADVVFEASGAQGSLALAARIARPEAPVLIVGSARASEPSFPLSEFSEKRIKLIGAHVGVMTDSVSRGDVWGYRQEGELFLRLLQSGRLRIAPLVSHSISADPVEVNRFYESVLNQEIRPVGALLDWS
jgi:threonine dehydrogenase-like Zn-dependent dehydrogenase